LTHAVSINSTSTAEQHNNTQSSHQNDFDYCVSSTSGTNLNGSVGNLNIISKPLNYHYHSNRKQSSSSTSSSSSSSSTSSELTSNNYENHKSHHESTEFIDLDEIADNPNSLLVNFKCSLSDEKEVEWKTLLVNGTLYVDIPTSVLSDGSRDSFVSLLEFAEDKL